MEKELQSQFSQQHSRPTGNWCRFFPPRLTECDMRESSVADLRLNAKRTTSNQQSRKSIGYVLYQRINDK